MSNNIIKLINVTRIRENSSTKLRKNLANKKMKKFSTSVLSKIYPLLYLRLILFILFKIIWSNSVIRNGKTPPRNFEKRKKRTFRVFVGCKPKLLKAECFFLSLI